MKNAPPPSRNRVNRRKENSHRCGNTSNVNVLWIKIITNWEYESVYAVLIMHIYILFLPLYIFHDVILTS